jgi:hypothetical protein
VTVLCTSVVFNSFQSNFIFVLLLDFHSNIEVCRTNILSSLAEEETSPVRKLVETEPN